ncbi:hypothetical protein [Bradyrhizobium sp.]|uniref:hypothetical protein n=1 Tax=Bradyrhizobium sp. TaxID=376 RepID=UPI00271A52C5|nr:hypothetical protein [Bradyrhizobium sp.]MDO9294976.1 hypothetical protein [Bradyrhizobium sp.]
MSNPFAAPNATSYPLLVAFPVAAQRDDQQSHYRRSSPPTPIAAATAAMIDMDQAFCKFPEIQSACVRTGTGGNAAMDTISAIIATVPDVFLLLAVAIGTIPGRIKIRRSNKAPR